MEHLTDRAIGDVNKDSSAHLLEDANQAGKTFGGLKSFEKKAVPTLVADKYLPGIQIDVEMRN